MSCLIVGGGVGCCGNSVCAGNCRVRVENASSFRGSSNPVRVVYFAEQRRPPAYRPSVRRQRLFGVATARGKRLPKVPSCNSAVICKDVVGSFCASQVSGGGVWGMPTSVRARAVHGHHDKSESCGEPAFVPQASIQTGSEFS